MRIFYNLIIVMALTTLSASIMEREDDFYRTLEDGQVFHARHPNSADPYFSYNDHEVTIDISPCKQSSLWRSDLNEDWFIHHRKKMILFFLESLDGTQEYLGFFWTELGGPLTFTKIPDEMVRASFKQLLNLDF